MRDKTSGRRTHHPTQTHMWEDNGKHWEVRERQDIENASTSSNTGTHVGTRQRGKSGDKVPGRRTRQPTKRKHEGRHWVGDEGRQDQGGHLKNALRIPRAVHCLEDKKGDNVERRGTRCSGRRTHQPTKGNKKGHRRRQKETRPSAKGNKKGRNAGEGETRPSGRNNQGYNGKHPREGVQQRERRRGTMGDKTVGKANTPSKKGRQEGVQWETKGDQTLRKVDTPSNKGKQEGVHWDTSRDKTLGKADAPSNKGKQEGAPSQRRRDKTLGNVDTPSNKGKQEGAQWRQRETRPDTLSNKGKQWETIKGRPDTPSNKVQQEGVHWDTSRDKTLGKADTRHPTKGSKKGHNGNKGRQDRTHHPTRGNNEGQLKEDRTHYPTKGNKKGYTGIQGETRASERRTHHPTKGNKRVQWAKGDKGRQDPRKGGQTIQQGEQRETRRGTIADKGRQNPGKGGHAIQQKETKRGTMGNGRQRETRPTRENKKGYNGRQLETTPSIRRTHHPTKGNKIGHTGIQGETRPSERQMHHPTKASKKGYNGQWETKGNKKEGVQWETSGDKLPGRRTHQPTKGNNKGYNGRQKETRSWGRRAHHSTPRRPP